MKIYNTSNKQHKNLHYNRGITPKRATTNGEHIRSSAPGQGNTAPKKRSSGGERLATLCPIRQARESNPKPPAPTTMSLTTATTDRFRMKIINIC